MFTQSIDYTLFIKSNTIVYIYLYIKKKTGRIQVLCKINILIFESIKVSHSKKPPYLFLTKS
jgi:hypothetical protein